MTMNVETNKDKNKNISKDMDIDMNKDSDIDINRNVALRSEPGNRRRNAARHNLKRGGAKSQELRRDSQSSYFA